jgi:hypothetical protein
MRFEFSKFWKNRVMAPLWKQTQSGGGNMTQAQRYRTLAGELRGYARASRSMREPILAVARHFEACAAALNAIETHNNVHGIKVASRAA